MSSRPRKVQNDPPALTNLESLILAQAVYEVGASPATWPSIAKLLSKHPLLSRPKSFFTPQSCHAMYDDLLRNTGLEFTEKSASPHASVNTQLAQKYYTLRFNELRELIAGEETKFKSIMAEIQDIRSGAWDNKIKVKLSGQPDPEHEVAESNQNIEESQTVKKTIEAQDNRPGIEEEVFDGSDLSGVTDSTSSPSQMDEAEKRVVEPSIAVRRDTTATSPPPPAFTETDATADRTTEPPNELPVDADMDIADDERAEENELAHQLVPDQISPVISSPDEGGTMNVESEPRLPDPDVIKDSRDSPITEVETQIPEIIPPTDEQYVEAATDENDNSGSLEEQEDSLHPKQPTEPARSQSEDRQMNIVNADTPKSNTEDSMIENDEDEQPSEDAPETTEGQGEVGADDIDTVMRTVDQGVTTAEVISRTDEPTEQQELVAEVEEHADVPDDNLSVNGEPMEKQEVEDSQSSLEQVQDDVPLRGDGTEDTGIAESVDDMQDVPPSEELVDPSTPAPEEDLTESAYPQDNVSEEEKDDGSEAVPTPLGAVLTEEEPQTERMTSANDEHSSDEGPSPPPKRSMRRRKSSATSTNPLASTRTRRQIHNTAEYESPAMEVDAEPDEDVDEDKALTEDIRPSPAPVDVAVSRRLHGKRKAAFLDGAETLRGAKRPRDESEPVDEEEAGPSVQNPRGRPPRQIARTEEQKRFQNVIGMLHSQISQHRNGNIFHNPIKNTEAPDYHDIVKRPMDLKTIKGKVKDGFIANSLEYQRDIYLMFANAMMYNRPESDVHSMAEDMMLESEGYIRTFRQTEGLVRGNRG